LVNQGAARNAAKVISPRTSFCTVKVDTDLY